MTTHTTADDLALTRLLVDPDRLAAWLDAHGLAPGEPVQVTRRTTGHSNEMFLVERGRHRWMLRRPPRVPLAPTAHDMAREARLLAALGPTGVPAPRLVAACGQADVIGAPFHLTEFRDGWVIRDSLPAAFSTADHLPVIGRAFMDALILLHAADWRALGLEGFGKPVGFLERQVSRWTSQLATYQTRPLPDMEVLAAWLVAARPSGEAATIIHGDFHLDNVMFAPEAPPRVIAILDWETATLGDPLMDVGLCTALWTDPGETALLSASSAGFREGLWTRRQLAEHYGAQTGRSIAQLAYYQALALFKLACILEGSWARHTRGAGDDPYFATFEEGVPAMARRAREFAGI